MTARKVYLIDSNTRTFPIHLNLHIISNIEKRRTLIIAVPRLTKSGKMLNVSQELREA